MDVLYISRTHPKALSASGSFFMANDIFIHVGAILERDS
jgi:uracil DNA glycosylase